MTTREPTLEDAYVALVTDAEPRTGRADVRRIVRTVGVGFALHFKQESRNPFFLWIVVCTPVIYATMAYFLFRARNSAGDARLRVGRRRADGDLVARPRPAARRAATAASARDPRAARRLPDSLLGDRCCRSRSRSRRSASTPLVTGLLYVRVLFGVPICGSRAGSRSPSRCPPTILSIGMLGFLLAAAFVRFRTAWAIGNLLRVPGLDDLRASSSRSRCCPGWVRADLVGARPDLGHERDPRRGARQLALARHRDVRRALGRLRRGRPRCCSASSCAAPA